MKKEELPWKTTEEIGGGSGDIEVDGIINSTETI